MKYIYFVAYVVKYKDIEGTEIGNYIGEFDFKIEDYARLLDMTKILEDIVGAEKLVIENLVLLKERA